jgi:hypothetical protein
MRACVVHLLVATYFPPFIGSLLFALGGGLSASPASSPVGPLGGALLISLVIPFFVWVFFLPLGMCSALFCRFAATRNYYNLLSWLIAWAIFGVFSAWAFEQLPPGLFGTDPHGGSFIFEVIGAVVGILVAPIHRYFWMELYEPPGFVRGVVKVRRSALK